MHNEILKVRLRHQKFLCKVLSVGNTDGKQKQKIETVYKCISNNNMLEYIWSI